MNQIPTIGRIVLYVLTSVDAETINVRRTQANLRDEAGVAAQNGVQVHRGNPVEAGQIYPMVIVRKWGDSPTACVNGKVLLDGEDDLWVTSRSLNAEKAPGTFHWPEISGIKGGGPGIVTNPSPPVPGTSARCGFNDGGTVTGGGSHVEPLVRGDFTLPRAQVEALDNIPSALNTGATPNL